LSGDFWGGFLCTRPLVVAKSKSKYSSEQTSELALVYHVTFRYKVGILRYTQVKVSVGACVSVHCSTMESLKKRTGTCS
jgi:hypothetical protein